MHRDAGLPGEGASAFLLIGGQVFFVQGRRTGCDRLNGPPLQKPQPSDQEAACEPAPPPMMVTRGDYVVGVCEGSSAVADEETALCLSARPFPGVGSVMTP